MRSKMIRAEAAHVADLENKLKLLQKHSSTLVRKLIWLKLHIQEKEIATSH